MEKFQVFLKNAKEADLKSRHIHLVLGNESCDLDSVASALCMAYLLHSKYDKQKNPILVIPIMNVPEKFFHLRTETCYLLQEYDIDPSTLIFADQINYAKILKHNKVQTTLVDHHVLSEHDKILEKTVVEIFDHRPINEDAICKNHGITKTVIKTVGSCATLIAKEFVESKSELEEVAFLLYACAFFYDSSGICRLKINTHIFSATIVFDTIALDIECGRTSNDDITTVAELERILKLPMTRQELFNILWDKHNDTSTLSTKDLLYRDLKIANGIPMPGFPCLVADYLKREDAEEALKSFVDEYDKKNLVLIGISVKGEVHRDVAIYFTDSGFKDTLVTLLTDSKPLTGDDLKLKELPVEVPNTVLFEQGNTKLTRKFILPLVNEAADRFYDKN